MAPFFLLIFPFDASVKNNTASRCPEMLGVECQMRPNKRRNKVVAVIVAFLHAHLNRVAGGAAGLFDQVRFELLFKEVIRCALIDQYGSVLGRLTQQHTGVVGCPC